MNKFLTSNDWQYRLLRTIVQGVLGVIIANIDLIVGHVVFDPSQKALIVALVMAVLSPIMALLGANDDDDGECDDYDEGEHSKPAIA